ncbi:MAG: PQQ-binding-like beta-propeller repeat protein [Acidobacteriota bacterium]|nr:PQQ-binding-like beta-propeller repeat protein [Acidobacteriota bacterium]MDQ3418571.1 PQQ-binding-like beta-propeller repeat protein [Acidobacteriota bacterium]
MSLKVSRGVRVWVAAALLLPAAAVLNGSDWPDWRGPARTGASTEKGLPENWSPAGENLAWRVPIGGRSSPVVFGDHLYLQTSSGSGATLQERIICFNADTGEQLWEHRYNLFTSDAPAHRIAWSSPAVDTTTGNVFAISGGGLLMSLSPDGKLLWERSLAEEFGMWTTHGGRMSSPIVDGEQVIVSGLTFMWGASANGAHRFLSFDKKTGRTNYVSAPEGRPTDTIYANAYVADVNGVRTFFSGGSDGAMHAIKINTGEKIWSWRVSQRGLNTAALGVGDDIIVAHSEENLGSSEMGMIAAVPMASKGELADKDARWLTRGIQAGYASPVTDGERLYVLDNGGVLIAVDLKTGKPLWHESLGTIAKASPVFADGKLYVGTENTGDAGGKFFIIRPTAAKAEILDQDWLGTPEKSELIIASPIVARGRVYVTSMDALYAIGPKGAAKASPPAPAPVTPAPAPAGPATVALVMPTDVIVKPGESLALTVKLFDANGNPVAGGADATWALENLKGTVAGGKFVADPTAGGQAGMVKATAGAVSAAARVRVIPDIPWTFDFEDGAVPSHWINAAGKFAVRDEEGSKVLVKLAENPFAFAKRTRPFFGSPELSNYTIEAEVRSKDLRRVMSDVGIVAQRYELVLFGNHQRLELQPWQPETQRTVKKAFTWAKDTWYVMKLEVQSMDGTNVRARGKVWPKGEPEPAEWTIERVDPIGSLKGSPGIYADVPNADPKGGSEVYYDNIKVYPNKK